MREASLGRLRTDRIDLHQLHRLDPRMPVADQPGALDALRREGKIRYIGLDTLTAEQLEQALSLTGIASVQNRFNLIDRASDAVLKVCEAHGPAFLPWFPPAGGALTGATATALDAVAESRGATRGQIALAWLLHRSPRAVPDPGHRFARPSGGEPGGAGDRADDRGHEPPGGARIRMKESTRP